MKRAKAARRKRQQQRQREHVNVERLKSMISIRDLTAKRLQEAERRRRRRKKKKRPPKHKQPRRSRSGRILRNPVEYWRSNREEEDKEKETKGMTIVSHRLTKIGSHKTQNPHERIQKILNHELNNGYTAIERLRTHSIPCINHVIQEDIMKDDTIMFQMMLKGPFRQNRTEFRTLDFDSACTYMMEVVPPCEDPTAGCVYLFELIVTGPSYLFDDRTDPAIWQ